MSVAETAPAKLNLALHVRRRREDGHHDLETVFAFCEFGDGLVATPAHALTLQVNGRFGQAIEGDNLVLRAARALAAEAGVGDGAALRLDKRIPVAAGLGGGSADAAAALRALDRLWGLGWPLERLAGLGATLGADVPACLWSRPMRGEGRGERLAPVRDAFAGTPVLLVNPGVALATGPVFARWDGADRGPLGPLEGWPALLAARNDLEPPALALAPAIGEVLEALRAQPGQHLARMSGSGATCFALFGSEAACLEAAARLRSERPGWWIEPTRLAAA